MALVSGTLFLLDLHRRALGDGRLHILEAGATAAILGAISTVRFDASGYVQFGTFAAVLWTAAGAGLLWGAVSAAVLRLARAELRFYIQLTLLESGLLYLALEHEPAEALRSLRQQAHWSRLAANPAGNVSFAQRMQAVLRTYPACASALGYQPYPAWARYTAAALTTLASGLALGAIWMITFATQTGPQPDPLSFGATVTGSTASGSLMRNLGLSLLTCAVAYLLSATLGQARRTAVMLALVDILHGPVEPGRATLTRG